MLGPLRFIYTGTASVRKDAKTIYESLKIKPRYWFENHGTQVLSSGLDESVEIVLAEHRNGKPPIFIFQVDDVGAYKGESLGIPTGDCKILLELGTFTLAVFQETRPGGADAHYRDESNKSRRSL